MEKQSWHYDEKNILKSHYDEKKIHVSKNDEISIIEN